MRPAVMWNLPERFTTLLERCVLFVAAPEQEMVSWQCIEFHKWCVLTFIHTLTLQDYEMCQLRDELVTVFIDKLEAAVIICILNVLYE